MKNKIIIGAVLVTLAGVMYWSFKPVEVSAEDKNQVGKGDEELSGKGGILENPENIKQPEINDSTIINIELDEFDPNDI